MIIVKQAVDDEVEGNEKMNRRELKEHSRLKKNRIRSNLKYK